MYKIMYTLDKTSGHVDASKFFFGEAKSIFIACFLKGFCQDWRAAEKYANFSFSSVMNRFKNLKFHKICVVIFLNISSSEQASSVPYSNRVFLVTVVL